LQDKLPTCPILDAGTYTVSKSGKRLVHGDVCVGIDKFIQDTDGKGKCPMGGGGRHSGGGSGGGSSSSAGHKLFSGLLSLGLISAVFIGIAGFWYKFFATETARVQAEDLIYSVKGFCESLAGLVGEKVMGLIGKGGSSGVYGASRYEPLDAELNYFQPIADASEELPLSGGAVNGPDSGVFTVR
jgi:hypothetical protein